MLSLLINVPDKPLCKSSSMYMLICSKLVQEPRKGHLLIVLDPVKHEWRSIGERLYVGYGDIKSEEYCVSHDNIARLSEFLQVWMNQRKCEVSWKTILLS